MVSKLIFIRWGKGARRYKVKDFSAYYKVGKKGRFNLYAKKKTKRKKQKRVRLAEKRKRAVISRKEEGFIAKIKGKNFGEEQKIERRMLKEVRLLPVFDRKQYIKQINPGKEVVTDGKIYGSFRDLENNKRDIYMGLMKNLVVSKNEKFMGRMYALRKELLKDGMVIEVDIYGMLSKKGKRVLYLGTMAFVGLMIEEAGFIENDLIGWAGENRAIEPFFNRLVKSQGGQKAYWLKNNMAYDTENVFLTNVNLRFSYA